MFLISSCSCFCPSHSSQVLNGEGRCNWSSADGQCSSYIWVINSFIAYWGVTYIRGLTVFCPIMSLLPSVYGGIMSLLLSVYGGIMSLLLSVYGGSREGGEAMWNRRSLRNVQWPGLLWLSGGISEVSGRIGAWNFGGHNWDYCLGFLSWTHWGWDKVAAISQTAFSNTFSLMKIYEFRLFGAKPII